MRGLAFLILLAVAAPWPAATQQRPDLTRFRAFADPLVGDWSVTIKDREADGKVTWEATQHRTFGYTLLGEFLEERAVDRGQTIGLHLLSFDAKRNRLVQQGFWPGSAGVLFTVEADLAADNRSASGHIEMPGEEGVRKRRRLELRWRSADELSYTAFAIDAAGREYVNEELVYRRSK